MQVYPAPALPSAHDPKVSPKAANSNTAPPRKLDAPPPPPAAEPKSFPSGEPRP